MSLPTIEVESGLGEANDPGIAVETLPISRMGEDPGEGSKAVFCWAMCPPPFIQVSCDIPSTGYGTALG